MKILIATPVYGDILSSGYHVSILETIGFFAREFPHIEFVHHVRSTSFFPQVRNVLASNVLNDPSFTHLLLVDPDMAFAPTLVAKMLAFGKPVVGAVYPEKRRDFDNFRRALQGGAGSVKADLVTVDYVYAGDALMTRKDKAGRDELDVVDGFVRVRRAGTGMLLVARSALETIKTKMPELWVEKPDKWVVDMGLGEGGYLQCFAVETGRDGLEIGSDVAFSKRWVDGCAGEIWSCVDEAIIRIGSENYVGHFLTRMLETADDSLVVVRKSGPQDVQG